MTTGHSRVCYFVRYLRDFLEEKYYFFYCEVISVSLECIVHVDIRGQSVLIIDEALVIDKCRGNKLHLFCKMTELVTDALPSERNTLRINDDFNIDLEVLQNLEKDLLEYEKMTLVFLILEDYNCFQQFYKTFHGQNVGNISEFVGKIQNWETKFFEALCITNAKREIRMLGKTFDKLEKIYVPIAMNTDPRVPNGNKVHLGAKLLFHLFDNVLGDDERNRLLERIHKELDRPEGFKDDEGMEEWIHVLWWVEKGFITLSSDGYGDFQKLLKHLKAIGLCEHVTYLDMEKYTQNSRAKIQNPALPTSQLLQSHVLTQNINENSNKTSIISKSPPNTIKNAYVIIINIITVLNSKYEDRDSSIVDVLKLESTFHGLGYTSVKIYNECTKNDINKIFRALKNDFNREKFDGLIVCILSHGVERHFVSHDNVEVPLSLIEDFICITELQKLPKIVIVQACQGEIIPRAIETIKSSNLTADGPRDDRYINLLNHDQFLMFSSTMSKCRAIRHKKDGSWFIGAVCNVLQENEEGEEPLSVIKWTQRVKSLVKKNRGELEKGLIAAQLPEVLNDRFDDYFYFPNYRNKRL